MKGYLFGQTEYNMLDNTIKLDDYISSAKASNFDFLSITDKNLYGNYKFYTTCLENAIKPIIGLSLNLADFNGDISTYLFYPFSNKGFKNLLKISTLANTTTISLFNDIKEYLEDVYVILSFNDSVLEKTILNGDTFTTIDILNNLKVNNYYLGISKTNNLSKVNVISIAEDLAIKSMVKILPIHNSKYLNVDDTLAYEALCLIGDRNIKIKDYEDYSFLANPIESNELDSFVNNINLKLYEDKLSLPKYPKTKGVSSYEYLSALAFKGLEKRLRNYSLNYKERLEHELSIIHKMGYDDYFLIVWDFIKFSKQNKILVGPGRGSAAGSLVAYCIGITEIDPLKYNLLFERFLNPERVSMPDIDVDFPDNKRDLVIEYVKNLFGNDHICNISAFGSFQIKSSIRDLGRVYKIEASRIDELISIVMSKGFTNAIEEYKDREDVASFLTIASKLNNLPKNISTHAAGIILSDLDLSTLIPLQTGINGLYQSQMEAYDLEKIGLLKMDFLGIRNLAMIDEIVRAIKGDFDFDFLRKIPLNDVRTFNILQNGDTLGIFQLESQGITSVLKKLKPTCFLDIVAVLALYRPGPMDNIDEFIARKNYKAYNYINPILKPILEETHGIIVYQEQIMLIATSFAGYSLGEADLLRRAVSKKNATMLENLKSSFIDRSIQMGHRKEEAEEIYELIYKFANYGFNKSHSVAYGLISYWMAFLKANYFEVFMTNMLNYDISNSKKLIEYIKYSKLRGLNVIKPNINYSSNKFASSSNGIYIPLTVIFSIGLIIANQIIDERNKNGLFKDFNEFVCRCSFLSDSCLQALVFSGAFDSFFMSKKNMIENNNKATSIFLKHLTGVIEDKSEYDEEYLRVNEKKYLGMNIEYDLFKNYDILIKKYNCFKLEMAPGQTKCYLLSFNKIKEIKTKAHELMAVGEAFDGEKTIPYVIFPQSFNSMGIKLNLDVLYLVEGRININKENKLQLIIDRIKSI